MKAAFYLDNSKIGNADLRYPEKGNPGVGGTQYLFVATPFYIKNLSSIEIEVTIYAHHIDKLPDSLNVDKVDNIEEALDSAIEKEYDFFVFRPTSEHKNGSFFQKLGSAVNLKAIAWAHNTPDIFTLNKLYKNKNLSCFLCVSQEQYDRLRDHPIIYKSHRIFNGFDITDYKPKNKIAKNSNTVAYIGSLVPTKGFHWLAQAWPNVLKKKPNAKLIVMGTGKLYDDSAKLGKWGVAEEGYEGKYIRPYLSNKEGEPHPSVDFKGLVGVEKIEIMQHVDVGVINPSGKSENCPGSALEFQAAGTPVVSSAKKGILDTVLHNHTGLLGKNIRDLSDNIIKLLSTSDLAYRYGCNAINFVDDKFNWEKIIGEWDHLFNILKNGNKIDISAIENFKYNDLKILREKLRVAKKYTGLKNYINPSIHSLSGYIKYYKKNLVK